MIRHTVVRPRMTIHGEFFVLVNDVSLPQKHDSFPAAINHSRRIAKQIAEDNHGGFEFTNQIGYTQFDYQFFLVTWDDEFASQKNESKKRFAIKERQVMPMLGALLSFIGAYLIGTRAETSKDWFLFIVMTISFACSAINAYEARK